MELPAIPVSQIHSVTRRLRDRTGCGFDNIGPSDIRALLSPALSWLGDIFLEIEPVAMAVDGEPHLLEAQTDIRRPWHCSHSLVDQTLDSVARCRRASGHVRMLDFGTRLLRAPAL